MSEIVEMVARAMSIEDKGVDHWEVMSEDGDGYGYVGKNEYRAMARAGIEAMRKPTRKMLSAGGFYHITGPGSVSESDMEIAKREWQAMIDEALK